jgi:hypothetical protein
MRFTFSVNKILTSSSHVFNAASSIQILKLQRAQWNSVYCAHFRFIFEVLTVAKMSILVLWVVTLRGLVGDYPRSSETT